MDISQRLFRLLQSVAEDKFETIARWIEDGNGKIEERLKGWEEKVESDRDRFFKSGDRRKRPSEEPYHQTDGDGQVRDDLQLFGLTPPSSLDEVRQIRNRELKKFHPDKYAGEPHKLETAKKIVQIYNAAYDRLKRHYSG